MSDTTITFGVDLKELQAGIDRAGKMVDGFQKGMGRASGAALKLSGIIQGIGLASNSAAGMAGNLLAGFALGGPMGLAVAGVNTLVAAIKESGAAEEEALKKTQAAQAARRKQYAETAAQLARLRFIEAGGSGAVWDAYQKNELARQGEMFAQDEADHATEALDAAIARIPAAAAMKAAGKSIEEITRYYPTLRDEVDRVTAAQKELADAIQHTKDVQATGTIEVNKAVAAAEDKAKAEADAERAKAEAAAKADAKIRGDAWDLQAKVPGVDTVDAGGRVDDQFRGVVGTDRAAQLAEQSWERERQRDLAALKVQEDLDKQADEAMQTSVAIADSWVSALDQMLGATKLSAAQIARIFANLAGQMMQQAGFAMGGPLGSLAGLILGKALPSADGGWDIPRGINPIAQLHSGEMVLPQAQADVVRDLAGRGGGAQPTMPVTIVAMDGPSLRDFLVRNGTDFNAAVRELARQGR